MSVVPCPTQYWQIASALRLDASERTLHRGDDLVALPPRAFDLLVRLAQAEGHLLNKEQLLEEVWQDRMVEEGTLSRHVWLLRKALGNDAALLETAPKVGYRLLGVRPLTAPSGAPPRAALPSDSGSAVRPPTPRAWNVWHLSMLGLGLSLVLAGLWASTRHAADTGASASLVQLEQARVLNLRAQALVARRSEADLIEAVQLYRQAIVLAPHEASHHAGLAMSMALLSGVVLPASSYDSARQSAHRTLLLQPDNVDGLSVLGLVAMNRDRDWSEAETHFRRVLTIDEHHVRARHWLGEMLVLLGERQEEGLALLEQARALAPQEIAIASDLAKAAYFSRQHERAVQSADRAIELDPAFAHAHRWRALALLALGRCAQALEGARDAARLDPSAVVRAEQIYILGRCGDRQRAGELAAQLHGASTAEYVSPIALLLAALALNDHAGALDALEEAVRNGNMVLGVATAPALDVLRSEPRFLAVMARIHAEPVTVSNR